MWFSGTMLRELWYNTLSIYFISEAAWLVPSFRITIQLYSQKVRWLLMSHYRHCSRSQTQTPKCNLWGKKVTSTAGKWMTRARLSCFHGDTFGEKMWLIMTICLLPLLITANFQWIHFAKRGALSVASTLLPLWVTLSWFRSTPISRCLIVQHLKPSYIFRFICAQPWVLPMWEN